MRFLRMLLAALLLFVAELTYAQTCEPNDGPCTHTHTMPQVPYTPGSDTRVDQDYRTAIARSVVLSTMGNVVYRNGDKINILFSDGAKQTFLIKIENGEFGVSPVPGTHREPVVTAYGGGNETYGGYCSGLGGSTVTVLGFWQWYGVEIEGTTVGTWEFQVTGFEYGGGSCYP